MSASSAIQVYWLPGCSSCVKVKEFLGKIGVPFESVNVAADSKAVEAVKMLGARSVPIVARGDQFVYAQSLEVVAQFIGKQMKIDRLPPPILLSKLFEILKIAVACTECLPESSLVGRVIPERDRSIGALAAHVLQIGAAFVTVMNTDSNEWVQLSIGELPVDVDSKLALGQYARDVMRDMTKWRMNNETLGSSFWTEPKNMEHGLGSRHEFLERSTWHAAQHTRHLKAVLERLNVQNTPVLSKSLLEGLPLPESLWE